MAILINNGVQNILGTPGAISGVFSDRPAAPNLAEGTLYFSTDTTTIYQVDNGVWIVYSGGGGGGGVNSVIGIKPISSSGGTDPEISITQAGVASDGYLSEGDWNIFNSKLNAVTASLPLSSTGGTDPDISISQAGIVSDGYLNSIDWNTFNDKIGGGGASTRVAFFTAGKVITGSPQFIWDFANNRLGVGGLPLGYKLSVIDANYYARFGTTVGSDNYSITFGKSTGSYISFQGTGTEVRKLLIGDGATGFANITSYSNNIIQFSYSQAGGIVQLPPILTLFSGNFFYSAGTNNHTQIYLQPSIQTSGGTNLLRGVYYAPIKTTDTGTTQIAWENTEGAIVFGNLASALKPITFVDETGKLGNSFLINDTANVRLYSIFSGNEIGIDINVNTNRYYFGNFNADWYLRIVDGSELYLNGIKCGFKGNAGQSIIGDVGNYDNLTTFGVDDNNVYLIASSNLEDVDTGNASGKGIRVFINGEQFTIPLNKI